MKLIIKILLFGSFLSYFISLFLPAAPTFDSRSVQEITEITRGYHYLIFGWLAFGTNFAWFSNIIYAVAIVFATLKKYKISCIFSITAFIVGLQSLNDVYYENKIVAHSSVNSPAFYVWESSFILVFLYSLVQFLYSKNNKNTDTPEAVGTNQ